MILIKEITKEKDNKFSLSLDEGTKVKLYDETILKFNLYVGSVIDSLDEVNKYNDLMSLYFLYVKKLSKRRISEKSFLSILKEKNLSNKDEIILIEKLKKVNLINDEIYIRSYINDCVNLRNDGPIKIKKNLYKEGIDIDVSNYLSEIDSELWNNKIEKIIKKRIAANHKYSNKVLYEKIKCYLYNLGYDNFENKIHLCSEYEVSTLRTVYSKMLRQGVVEKNILIKLSKLGFKSENIDLLIKENKD